MDNQGAADDNLIVNLDTGEFPFDSDQSGDLNSAKAHNGNRVSEGATRWWTEVPCHQRGTDPRMMTDLTGTQKRYSQ